MKKTFTLMLTLVFAITMSAATGVGPKTGTALNAAPFQKTLAMKSAKIISPEKKATLRQIQKEMFLKNTDGKMVTEFPFAKMPKPATAAALSKAPRKADGETVDITISGTYQFTHYDGATDFSTGDWYFGGLDDTKTYFVRLDYLQSEAKKYGTFTLSDLDSDLSYITDLTDEKEPGYYSYEEGTTFTVSRKGDHDIIEGTLVCSNGVTYNLYVDHTPETIDIEGTELTAASYTDGDWNIIFNNSQYSVVLDLESPDGTFDGTYTEDNAYLKWCCAQNLETLNSEMFKSLNVTMTMADNVQTPLKGCEITGSALGENGNTYNFHMKVNPPITPKDSVDIDVTLKTADWPSSREDCRAFFEVTEIDEAGLPTNIQWNIGLKKLTGTSNEDYYIAKTLTKRFNTESGDTVTFDHGTVKETLDPQTLILHVVADLVMSDSIDYHFAFDYQAKTVGEVEYTFTNLTLNNSLWNYYGVRFLNADSDNVKFQLQVYGDVPGEYDNSNAYAVMRFGDDKNYTDIGSITLDYAVSTLDERGNPVLDCRYIGSDLKVYTVNAYFEIPAIKDTLDVSISGMEVTDLIDEMGAFQIAGYNNDSTMFVSLAPEAAQFPGHYTIDNLIEYSSYCYLVIINKEAQTYVQNPIYAADFDVTQDGKDIYLTGQFQAGNHWVNMNLQGKIKMEGLDYDVEDEDVDASFEQGDIQELVKYENQGYAYVKLINAERNDCFAMLIFLNHYDEDDDVIFPAGTYEINGSFAVNSVQQGSFNSNFTSIYPTFYGYCTENGNISLPLWLFRSGNVTVKKTEAGELAFEVNALNSYERTCHITYNWEISGIKNVNAGNADGARKMVDNKQIVIKNGRQKFNILGQSLSE